MMFLAISERSLLNATHSLCTTYMGNECNSVSRYVDKMEKGGREEQEDEQKKPVSLIKM